MQKLFEPRVLGAGIIIGRKPTLPDHGVRKSDLEQHTQLLKYSIVDVTDVEIPLVSNQYIVQCFDTENQPTFPDYIGPSEDGTALQMRFLVPQSGTVHVMFVGGTGGD